MQWLVVDVSLLTTLTPGYLPWPWDLVGRLLRESWRVGRLLCKSWQTEHHVRGLAVCRKRNRGCS